MVPPEGFCLDDAAKTILFENAQCSGGLQAASVAA